MDTFSTASLNSWDLCPQRPWMFRNTQQTRSNSQRSEHESSSWILWLNNLTSMAFCSNYLQLSKDNNHQMEKRWKKRYKNSIFTQPPAPRPPSSLTWTPKAPRRNQRPEPCTHRGWPWDSEVPHSHSLAGSGPSGPAHRKTPVSDHWKKHLKIEAWPWQSTYPPSETCVLKKQREILFWRLFSRFILQGTIWFVDFNGWSISDVYVFSHARHPLHKKHWDFSINWI